MQETRIPSLGWKDPLEKGMATHFSTLAWTIPRIEEPGGLQSSLGLWSVKHDWVIKYNTAQAKFCAAFGKGMCVCVCVCVYTYTFKK